MDPSLIKKALEEEEEVKIEPLFEEDTMFMESPASVDELFQIDASASQPLDNESMLVGSSSSIMDSSTMQTTIDYEKAKLYAEAIEIDSKAMLAFLDSIFNTEVELDDSPSQPSDKPLPSSNNQKVDQRSINLQEGPLETWDWEEIKEELYDWKFCESDWEIV